MLCCCQKNHLLGLAGACFVEEVIAEQESHPRLGVELLCSEPFVFELQNLMWAVFQLHMRGVLDYRVPVVEYKWVVVHQTHVVDTFCIYYIF